MFLPTWPIERIISVAGWLRDEDNIRVFLCLQVMRALKDQKGFRKSQYHRSASQSLQSRPVPSKTEEKQSFGIELADRGILV
jgi:hypothetical protein